MSGRLALLLLFVTACGGSSKTAEVPAVDAGLPGPIEVDAPEPTLTRLTQSQYGHVINDLLTPDIALPPALEPDIALEHLIAIGASNTTISPRGAEQYESAARNIARQVYEDDTFRQSLTTCEDPSAWGRCYGEFAGTFGRRVWRRPLTAQEIETLVGLAEQAQAALGTSTGDNVVADDYYRGVEMVMYSLLQSPHFLYRVELGEADPTDSDRRRVTAYEMASRLSFFLWNSAPDTALLDAAESGALHTRDGRLAQVERMMEDPKLKRSIRNFFWEWWQLFKLNALTKDPTVYTHYSPDLGGMAAEETLRLVEHVVLEQDTDMAELLTSRTTFVNRRLAAIYNIPAVTRDGFGQTEFPADSPRRGFLGQVSFLAQNAHPVSTSVTLRGIFVREILLCQSIPPPLSEVNTALPEPAPDAKTMRDRLTVHMEDPTCAACHTLTDLVGLTLEHFDGIGRYRLTDDGATIDASGELDGATYDDALGLQDALTDHPEFAKCAVKTLYSYALGRRALLGDMAQLGQLTERFQANGRRFKQLMADVALSTGFERIGEVAP